MKITIVCGHFVPKLGYIEVHLANALHRLGNEVVVITSNQTSSSAKYLASSQTNEETEYTVVRLNSWLSIGQLVLSKGVAREVKRLNPDKVIVIGLGKIFPRKVFTIPSRTFELITLLGDNEDTYTSATKTIKRVFLQKFLKTPIYKKAIKESNRLIGYTPSTREIVETFINGELAKELASKYTTLSLGFDETEFNYSTADRNKLRKELGIQEEELTIITATRVTSSKKIERIIDAMEELSNRGIRFKYVLIGFSKNEYCEQLLDYIDTKQIGERIIPLPFMERSKMNSYYNMADIGLWPQAAISIFEGLATGLFLLLPKKKNVSHILNSDLGVYYSDSDLLAKLEQSIATYNQKIRSKNAATVKSRFSFSTIAQKIIEG